MVLCNVHKIGSNSVAMVELLEIFYGLQLDWRIGHRQVWMESDSEVVISLIQNNGTHHRYAAIISSIKQHFSRA